MTNSLGSNFAVIMTLYLVISLPNIVIVRRESWFQSSRLRMIPDEVVGHCLSFLGSTEHRFALQTTCQQFHPKSNCDAMLVGVTLGRDWETGRNHGIIQEHDIAATAAAVLMPFARAAILRLSTACWVWSNVLPSGFWMRHLFAQTSIQTRICSGLRNKSQVQCADGYGIEKFVDNGLSKPKFLQMAYHFTFNDYTQDGESASFSSFSQPT